VRELLPGTARVMGDRFGACFFQYCEGQPSALDRVDEARAFAGYLLDAAHDQSPDPASSIFLTDLITCERHCLEVVHGAKDGEQDGLGIDEERQKAENPLDTNPWLTSRARVAAFGCDLEKLYPRVLDGEAVEAKPDPCFVLIGKVRGAVRARLKRINIATARLLILCDGTRTLAAIVSSYSLKVMQQTNGNKSEAARRLGISRTRLQRVLESGGENADPLIAENAARTNASEGGAAPAADRSATSRAARAACRIPRPTARRPGNRPASATLPRAS